MQQQSEYRTIDRLQVRSDDVDVVFDVKSDGRSFGEFDLWEMIEAFAYFNTPAQEEFWDTSKTIAELAEGGMYAEQLKNELGIVISPITTDIELNGLETFLTEGYEPPTGIVYKLYLYDHPEPAPAPEPSRSGPFDDMPPLVYNVKYHENGRYSIGFTVPAASTYPYLPFTFTNTVISNSFDEALARCKKDVDDLVRNNTWINGGRSLKRILAEENDD